MVIKSLSRRSKSFGQLLEYMQKEAKQQGYKREEIFHNLPFLENTHQGLEQEFKNNAHYLKERKNGVSLYHEILSLHPDDKEHVTPLLLQGLAEYYLHLRAPEGLAYGVVHTDTKNAHIHLMISANVIGGSQKIRLSKAQFQRVKKSMRVYIQKHYPYLQNTLQANTGRKKTMRSQKEQGMNKRNKKDKHLSQKEEIHQRVKNILKTTISPSDFEESLQKQGLKLYIRGKQYGIIWKKKKYRLKTLGLAEAFYQQKKSWLLIKKRKKSVQSIYLKKFIQNWKEKGFRENILQALNAKKQNDNLEQLRKMTKRKQGRKGFGYSRG